ncbi:hypothetical protein DBR06_SOUSAS13410032 [Sousa chinensis]|nr:hypothetical protein DBR06_SOUSAS13410032 [Sousa chinensis]
MDFLRGVTAALLSLDGMGLRNQSPGVFFAAMLFALDFYLTFHNVAEFLKQGDSAEVTAAHKMEVGNSDCDSGGAQGAVKNVMKNIMAGLQQTNSEKILLSWVRQSTRNYPQVNVINFTTSWSDGLALNALIHSHSHMLHSKGRNILILLFMYTFADEQKYRGSGYAVLVGSLAFSFQVEDFSPASVFTDYIC